MLCCVHTLFELCVCMCTRIINILKASTFCCCWVRFFQCRSRFFVHAVRQYALGQQVQHSNVKTMCICATAATRMLAYMRCNVQYVNTHTSCTYHMHTCSAHVHVYQRSLAHYCMYECTCMCACACMCAYVCMMHACVHNVQCTMCTYMYTHTRAYMYHL